MDSLAMMEPQPQKWTHAMPLKQSTIPPPPQTPTALLLLLLLHFFAFYCLLIYYYLFGLTTPINRQIRPYWNCASNWIWWALSNVNIRVMDQKLHFYPTFKHTQIHKTIKNDQIGMLQLPPRRPEVSPLLLYLYY